MFKKIEVWVLYLILLLVIIFIMFFGAIVKHEVTGGKFLKNNNLKWVGDTFLFISDIPANLKKILTLSPSVTNGNMLNDRFSLTSLYLPSVSSFYIYIKGVFSVRALGEYAPVFLWRGKNQRGR